MEAEIPASNLRLFSRCLQMLHKIGDLVTFETSAERLVLRALSRAESAYAQIAFAPTFFTAFHHRTDPAQLPADSSSARSPSPAASSVASTGGSTRYHTVQVNSKMLQVPFRSALSAVKRVTLRLCPADEQGFAEVEGPLPAGQLSGKRRRVGGERIERDVCLMVQLHLEESGVVKTFRLPTLEQANVLQPNFSRQSCPTLIGAKAKRFEQWLQSFPDVEELSVTCSKDIVRFRSFLDWAAINDAGGLEAQVNAAMEGHAPAKVKAKALKIRAFVQTESAVSSDEFSVYTISQSCEEQPMVFTLPEVRHFAQLCEMSDEDLFIFAMQPGQPVLLTNTRKPFLTQAQQRALRQARQGSSQQQPEGSEEFIASTLPPSPRSIADSQMSYNTSAAVEQTQRTWSGELILATLAPEVAMLSSQASNSQPSQQGQPQQQPAGQRQPSRSPSPPGVEDGRGEQDGKRGGGASPMVLDASPKLSPTFDL